MLGPSTSAMRFGALLGGCVGALGQLVIALARDDGHLVLWRSRLLGVVFDAALIAAVALLACATVTAALPKRFGLGVRTTLATSLVVPVAVFTALGVLLHALLGSPLTVGGLEFFVAGAAHVLRSLFTRHLGFTLIGLAVASVLAVIIHRGLGRALSSEPSSRRTLALESALAFGVLAAVMAIDTPSFAGARELSPAAAFAASVRARARFEIDLPPEVEAMARVALESPPRIAETLFEEVAREHDPRTAPRVVLIMLESVGARDTGFGGRSPSVTPALDRLAETSRRFSRAYTTATHSNYAQMAVLSSLFPRRGDALDMYQRLDYPRRLWHDVLHQAGYQTATISSQDETWQGMLTFQTTRTPTTVFHALDHPGPHLDTGTERIVPDAITVDHAIDWVRQHRGNPFGLYVNLQATHFPYPLPDDAPRPNQPTATRKPVSYASYAREDTEAMRNRHANALGYVDREVGRLVEALEAEGILDETVIVVTSDHGELFHDHGLVTHGRTLHELEARVPLLVRYPRRVPPGDDARPVSTLDVLPTVVDLVGLPPHPAHQGQSLFADAPESGPPAIYLNIQGWVHAEAIVCHPHKLVVDTSGSHLFDLSVDPDERVDLAGQQPERARELAATLSAQMAAQRRYHAIGSGLRQERFAPRLLPCPGLAQLAARD